MAEGLDATVRHSPATGDTGMRVSRYVLLERVGAGAMGEVWAAWDPQLDRKVALKLLNPKLLASKDVDATDARTRLLREAQAMAQVRHPNAVAVHDAGEFAGDVFLAMDFIDGVTLKAWLQAPRARAQVLRVFDEAGQALAAAHAAGLVHRDFKPDNVIVDADGHPHVTDFGLARPVPGVTPQLPAGAAAAGAAAPALALELTSPGAVVGTPSYMPPEQLRGQSADARSDQFSFCVALYEALYGQRPFPGESFVELAFSVTRGEVRPPPPGAKVPDWLRAVVLRGLAVDPARRWPSMPALFEALAADPGARRRRWLVRGGAAAAAVGLAVGAVFLSRGEAPCTGAAEALAGTWGRSQREAVAASLRATKAPFAEQAAAGVVGALDEWAGRWVAMHQAACEATRVTGAQSDEVLTLRMQCLARRRDELGALVEQLSHADATIVQKAAVAAQSLADVATCADVAALRAPVPPPDPQVAAEVTALGPRLARVKALKDTGQYTPGLTEARALVADARATRYEPLLAEALAVQGDLAGRAGDAREAERALRLALASAERGHDDAQRALILVDLVWYVGSRLARHDEGYALAGQADAVLARLGGERRFERGRLDSYRGVLLRAQGRFPEALERLDAAVADLGQALGGAHPLVANALNNRGLVLWQLGRLDEALAAHEQALAIRRAALGELHPDLGGSLNNLALVREYQGDYAAAAALQVQALELKELTLGATHPALCSSLSNLAQMKVYLGEAAEALPLVERAIALREQAGEHPDLAALSCTHGDALEALGRLGPAKAAYTRCVELAVRLQGPQHPQVSEGRLGLARVALAEGNRAGALALASEAARAHAQATSPQHPVQRRLAVVEAEAALALARPREALAALERARSAQGGSKAERAEVDGLMARALVASGAERARAMALAEGALPALAAGGPRFERRRAELARWLEAQGPGGRPW